MTLLLAVVGVGVVILGAFILLVLPERPGGTVGWGDFQVKSTGAGLPLIVVGIVAIGFAIARGGSDGDFGSTASTSTTEGGIYSTNFEDQTRHPWEGGTYTDDGAYRIEASKGSLQSRVFATPNQAPVAEDASISVTAQKVAGPAEEGYGYGIFCRRTSDSSLYTFTLWANTATIAKRVNGAVYLQASTLDYGAARQGDAELELHAVCASSEEGNAIYLKFWITKDGKDLGDPLVNTDRDSPLTSGDYGLFAALGKRGGAEDTLTVEFDDFLVTHAG